MSDFTRQFQMSLVSYSYHLIIIYILSFFSSKTSSWVLFLHRKKQTFPDITVSLVSYCCFLAHLSWKLKWAFLITFRPSSVCLSVCLSVCKLFTFSSSPELMGQFQRNLAQSILGWRGFKFVQMKGPTLFQGGIITK